MEKDPPETVDRHRRMRGDGNDDGVVCTEYFYRIGTMYLYEDVIIDSWWTTDFYDLQFGMLHLGIIIRSDVIGVIILLG